MKAVLVGGGPVSELPDLKKWADACFIGIDRGAITLLDYGIRPAAAVGDFDSVTAEQYERLKRVFPDLAKVPSEKDETDTELALQQVMKLEPHEVVLTGVTGGRADHSMSALHAMYSAQKQFPAVSFCIEDRLNRQRFLSEGIHKLKRGNRYRYISFYPFAGKVTGFSLEGFKYGVSDETIAFGSTRFTSNELPGTGTVSIRQGVCLMIESTDDENGKMPG